MKKARITIMKSIMSDFKDVVVSEHTSFGETIEKMDQHEKSIALIVDEKNRLLGILTDGDIRKAILKGITLHENVKQTMNKNPFCLNPGCADGEMVRIMMENNIYHLPIVDDQKTLKGVVFKNTFIQQRVLLCPVVIMAGGMGRRLLPLTEDRPKPLLTVSGKPMIVHILEKFRDEGAKEFFICVNYKGTMIEEYLGDGSNYRVRINYIKETDRLGTSGALSLLPEISSPFFVINADVLTSIDFKAMYQFHNDNESILTMGIKKIQFDVPYGTVTLEHNRIINLSEKPSVENYINAGIYIIDNQCIEEIPINQHYDMTDFVSYLLSKNKKISGYLINGDWTDMGQLKDYFLANGVNPHNAEALKL
ncbi:MAG: CBS domain-containing protein [Deltaproteobacteria bacterium]|nr:CBS domain-containing protein [Deltaproteobacteria bacterium]